MTIRDSITFRYEDLDYDGQTITIKDNEGNLIATVQSGRHGTTVALGLPGVPGYALKVSSGRYGKEDEA